MRIELFIILTLLLSTSNLTAQISQGKITYKVVIDTSYAKRLKEKDTDNLLTTALHIAVNDRFELHFNTQNAVFKPVDKILESIESDSELIKISRIAFTAKNQYFQDKTNHVVLEEVDNNLYVLDSIKPNDWEITRETKMIQQFKCYKASFKEKFKGRDGKIGTRIITAWFSPELAFPYGPKNFFNLPGLILELNRKSTTFAAEKIILGNTNQTFSTPKGKTITRDDYERKMQFQAGY